MITYSLLSKVGTRKNNEDYTGMYDKDGTLCFVVADGLGGHKKGEVASQTVVGSIIEQFAQTDDLSAFLDKSIMNAQMELLKVQNEAGYTRDMKTTVTVLICGVKTMQWAYVGDSRLYLFEKGKVVMHTEDHSVPQLLVNMGEITDSQIRKHPDRNKLLRVMGDKWEKAGYTISEEISLKKGQTILMCTDGFWEMILERDMEICLSKAENVDQWIKYMENIVLENGSSNHKMDNYSAIGIWM